MKKEKKFFGIILSVLLVLFMMPAMAFAAEAQGDAEPEADPAGFVLEELTEGDGIEAGEENVDPMPVLEDEPLEGEPVDDQLELEPLEGEALVEEEGEDQVVVLASLNTTVNGLVVSTDGAPIPGVVVSIDIYYDLVPGVFDWMYFGSARTGVYGDFSITDNVKDDGTLSQYPIRIFAGAFSPFNNDEYFEVDSNGVNTTVEITPGSTKTINFVLTSNADLTTTNPDFYTMPDILTANDFNGNYYFNSNHLIIEHIANDTWKINQPFYLFYDLYQYFDSDGTFRKLRIPDDYTPSSGSTIITLSNAFLSANGNTYTLRAAFTTGIGDLRDSTGGTPTPIPPAPTPPPPYTPPTAPPPPPSTPGSTGGGGSVSESTTSGSSGGARTGDDMPLALWISLLVIAAVALVILLKRRASIVRNNK